MLQAAHNLAAANLVDVELARANEIGASRFPNPSVGFERQQTMDPNAQSQDLLTIDWPIPLGGRRGQRALAQVQRERAEARVASERYRLAQLAVQRFYTALYKRRVAEHLSQQLAALNEAVRVVEAREAAGDAPGADTLRIKLERAMLQSRQASAATEARQAQLELALWLRLEARTLDGEFRVSPPPAAEEIEQHALEHRADLRALRAVVRSAREASSLAGRVGWPELSLRAGYNRQAQPVGHGYAIGATLTLPLLEHGQGEAASGNALAARLPEQAQNALAAMHAQVRSAHLALTELLAEQSRFAQQEHAAELVGAVLAGYQQGEATVFQLVDAQRSSLDVALWRTELDWRVRMADVNLRAAAGNL